MNFTVTFDDGRVFEVTPTPGDFVRFERQFNIPVARIEADPRMEYVMFLAWAGLKRTQQYADDFENFLDHVVVTEDVASPKVEPLT